jgi:hypothetical protein
MTPSLRCTLAFTTDFLSLLLGQVHAGQARAHAMSEVLILDNDPLSNRLISSALRRAQLVPHCAEDPTLALATGAGNPLRSGAARRRDARHGWL